MIVEAEANRSLAVQAGGEGGAHRRRARHVVGRDIGEIRARDRSPDLAIERGVDAERSLAIAGGIGHRGHVKGQGARQTRGEIQQQIQARRRGIVSAGRKENQALRWDDLGGSPLHAAGESG